jgi:hypothetical protein
MRPRHFVWTLIVVSCFAASCSLFIHAQTAGGTNAAPASSGAVPAPAPSGTGPGIVPSVLPPFGDHDIGSVTDPQSAQLTNTSGAKAKLKIGAPSLLDYRLDASGCARELETGESCLLTVRFVPKVSGSRDATVEVAYEGSDKGPGNTLHLQGNGFPPFLGLSPKQLDFPQQSASATSSPQMVTVTNVLPPNSDGKHDVTVNRIAAGGDFTIDAPTLPHTLKPGASMSFPVRYAPKQEGLSTGTLLIGTADGSEREIRLRGSTYTIAGGFCSSVNKHEFLLMLMLSSIYWLAMIVVRWHRVANPTREMLRGEIATVRAEFELLPAPNAWREQVAAILLAGGLEVSPKIAHKKWYQRLANFLFWSRGQEITGWGYVHDAQEKMAAYQSHATVVARLEAAVEALKESGDSTSQALADIITKALQPDQNTGLDDLRALLEQALTALNDRADTDFSKLAGWQNKASWLVGCGLFTIVVLTAAVPHHSILFVVGAAGGLISRMSRSLNRKDVPTDYGASWTTLFLSPVSGALGAWAGILISELAVKVNVLGSAFQADFYEPCRATTLALAFVFGFSERLLDDVLDKLDDTATKDSSSPQTATTKPKPTQPAQATGLAAKLTIQPAMAPGNVNAQYDQKLQVSGNVGQVAWSVDAAKLPPGLKLTDAATGSIQGMPMQAGTFAFQATVQDSKSKQSQQVTIVINP